MQLPSNNGTLMQEDLPIRKMDSYNALCVSLHVADCSPSFAKQSNVKVVDAIPVSPASNYALAMIRFIDGYWNWNRRAPMLRFQATSCMWYQGLLIKISLKENKFSFVIKKFPF